MPLGAGLTEKQLSEFISTSMKQRGMLTGEDTDPVLSVWLSPEGTYAFVEFHTVEFANQALGLNGVMLLTTALRISRPNNYQPTLGTSLDGLIGIGASVPGTDSAVAAPALSVLGLGNLPNPAAVAAEPSAVLLSAPTLTSTALECANMMTKEDLADPEEREGLKEDVGDECKKFGEVDSIKIPVAGNDECKLFVKFSTVQSAEAALKSLAGRKFDGRIVAVKTITEEEFGAIKDGV